MHTLNDKWMRVAGVPLLSLLGQWMMYGYTNVPYPDDWRIPVFFVLGAVLVWEANRQGIIVSRQRYPELGQTRQRVLFQLVWFFFFAGIIRITQTLFYDLIGLWQTDDVFEIKPYFFNTLVSVIGTIQLAAMFEGIYLYQRWKVAYTEAQELKKVNLQSQLESLKTQINPHFLFNNLNSLSSLIGSAPRKAEEFLDDLSAVYRYLLQQNNRSLCPLADELQFIRAYFYLIKTRYGEGIFMKVDIDDRLLKHLIPPLTLQILFENAIKHNVISVNRPLTIRLYTRDNTLFVENNFQKKKVAVPSNGIGLQNITMKYKLLDGPPVMIQQDESRFLVGVPLMKPKVEEPV
ncbi:sensor histidine kinase [Tellurirhabdus rosea]|uniref:sensor histidine kinase n=1 Tax=Tellurirhabdus rosea TaxID=2674997 RepID=UPI0022504F55|nr:histidine kinase [Tellurirhabdus rosea]